MRILVVGAGAVGGYFGGRLLEAGRKVTFLVRPGRAATLAVSGLCIRSPLGDAVLSHPPTVLAEELRPEVARHPMLGRSLSLAVPDFTSQQGAPANAQGASKSPPFDLVLLSCKAYDLEDAINSFAPAVGAETAIVPLLNGMRHLDLLDQRFGAERVLGGQCKVAATVNENGEIVQLSPMQEMSFGERAGGASERVRKIEEQLQGAGFKAEASPTILLEMWEKWVMLASLAGGTCLLRGSVGDITAAPGGSAFLLALLEQCRAIAAAAGYPPRAAFLERVRDLLTTAGSPLTASMLRDMERGARIEADHVIGDLLRRGPGPAAGALSPLGVVYAGLKVYEAGRER